MHGTHCYRSCGCCSTTSCLHSWWGLPLPKSLLLLTCVPPQPCSLPCDDTAGPSTMPSTASVHPHDSQHNMPELLHAPPPLLRAYAHSHCAVCCHSQAPEGLSSQVTCHCCGPVPLHCGTHPQTVPPILLTQQLLHGRQSAALPIMNQAETTALISQAQLRQTTDLSRLR